MKPDETVQEMESKLKVLDKRLARLHAEKRQLEEKLKPFRNAQNRAMEQNIRERNQHIEATLPELKVRLFQAVGYQRAVEVVTRGGSQIDLPRYGTQTLGDFTGWLIANRESIGWSGETPTSEQLESNPLRYVSSLLGHFDLRQKRVGKHNGQTYALEVEGLQRVLGI